MKVVLTSAYETHAMLDALQLLVESDRIKRHTLCDSAEQADAIIFVEDTHFDDYLYSRLLKHPLVAKYRDKVFMYNEADKPWAVLPGLYSNMPQRYFQPAMQVPFGFIKNPNQYIANVYGSGIEKRWLFSFVGSESHRCRRDVLALSDHSGGIRDTSQFNVWDSTAQARATQGSVYAQVMAESQYMLCPRGIGTSSSRLFESLESGVAPVIIANQWVPTPHIDWSFAVFVKECDVRKIPQLLEGIRDESAERGRAARAAWEAAYAPPVLFDTVCESIGWLLEEQQLKARHNPRFLFRKMLVGGEMATLSMLRAIRRQWQQAQS